MRTIQKVLLSALGVACFLFIVFFAGLHSGDKTGAKREHDKQQIVIDALTSKINASRTATVAKTAAVNAVSAGAVERVERVQAAKVVYRTQYVDRYKESPDASVTCLSVDSVDAINKLLELQEP